MIGSSYLKINDIEKLVITPDVGSLLNFFFDFIKSKERLFLLFDEFLHYIHNDYTFVINNSMEGWNFVGHIEYSLYLGHIDDNPLDWILEYVKLKNINSNSIKIYTSDLNCNDNTGKYSHIFTPIIYFNTFISFTDDYTALIDRVFTKKFLSLNRRIAMRDYRTSLYAFLKINNILTDSYYSFNSNNAIDLYKPIYLENYKLNNERDFYSESSVFYKTSFCNIVTETYFDNMYHLWNVDTMFLSEKIFKAINNCQPFIVFARHGYLKKLKELGFRTFDQWWDESYDNEVDSRERINKLLLLIKRISMYSVEELNQMYIEMIPILKHNFELSMKNEKYGKYDSFPRIDDEIESMVLKKIINE